MGLHKKALDVAESYTSPGDAIDEHVSHHAILQGFDLVCAAANELPQGPRLVGLSCTECGAFGRHIQKHQWC